MPLAFVCDTRSGYFFHLYYEDTVSLNFPGVPIGYLPPDPETWYRGDWADGNGVNVCKASYIAQSRFDRYEVYSSAMRRWTTALDTEQAIFSFPTNTDSPKGFWSPVYSFIVGRLLLATGACDDYDNESQGALYAIWGPSPIPPLLPTGTFSGVVAPAPFASTGTCNGHGIGNTGASLSLAEDIYGFTHDVANDMRQAAGKTLFINDTGHSIHDERPKFFATQIVDFLSHPDNNINIALATNDDDLRWNSEVHAVIGFQQPFSLTRPAIVGTIDIPLNYWFHPWPSGPTPSGSDQPAGLIGLLQPYGDWSNPCGVDCTKLNAFDLEQHSLHVFTIALPSNVDTSWIHSFQLEFVSGWNITAPGAWATYMFGAQVAFGGYGNDKWNLGAIAACFSGSTGSFVSDGFPLSNFQATGTIQAIQAGNFGLPGVPWTPPSFVGTANLPSTGNNCKQPFNPNPPPTSAAKPFM